MSRVTVSEAVKMVDVSQTQIYRDIGNGVLSADKDARGKKVIDVSELIRVYGDVRTPEDVGNNGNSHQDATVNNGNADIEEMVNNGNAHVENGAVVAVLEEQVELLKEQLELATTREQQLAAREQQLLDMLSTEQEKTKLLMLPKP